MLISRDNVIRAILDITPVGMLLANDAGEIVFVNHRACSLLEWDEEELLGRHINVLIPRRYHSAHDVSRHGYSKKPEARRMGGSRDLLALCRDGRELPVEIGLSPVELEEKQYVLVSLLDISDRHRAKDLEESNNKLAYMATHDQLTKLPNRAKLFHILDEATAGDRRSKALTLAFIDLDGFKAINDQYGHNVGDEVLREIANVIERHIRQTDVLGRLGGDEFLIIFRDMGNESHVQKVLNGIQHAVESLKEINGRKVKLSLSIGAIACPPGSKLGSAELIRRADELMYRAKKMGRNKIISETFKPKT